MAGTPEDQDRIASEQDAAPVINHQEALDLAYYKQKNSNLARAYIELRTLAIASLEAGAREATAAMAYETATNDFSHPEPEGKAYEKAMLAASAADKALYDAVTPNRYS